MDSMTLYSKATIAVRRFAWRSLACSCFFTHFASASVKVALMQDDAVPCVRTSHTSNLLISLYDVHSPPSLCHTSTAFLCKSLSSRIKSTQCDVGFNSNSALTYSISAKRFPDFSPLTLLCKNHFAAATIYGSQGCSHIIPAHCLLCCPVADAGSKSSWQTTIGVFLVLALLQQKLRT